MSDWRFDIDEVRLEFGSVAEMALDEIYSGDENLIELQQAPHKPPSRLPQGRMAVYGFWWNGAWLKIGKAGPNSGPRYTSHHYNLSAKSSLARSLSTDRSMLEIEDFDAFNPGEWIKANTCRVNFLLPSSRPIALLSLLEAFMHVRLRPRFEGPPAVLDVEAASDDRVEP